MFHPRFHPAAVEVSLGIVACSKVVLLIVATVCGCLLLLLLLLLSLDSVVGIATRLRAERPGFKSCRGKRYFSSPERPDGARADAASYSVGTGVLA